MFKKMLSKRFWGGLVLFNLLVSLVQVPQVLANSPVWNVFSGEENFLKVGYQSEDGSKIIEYGDSVEAPAEAKAGDLIKTRIYFHNGNPGTIATNVIAKLTGIEGEKSVFTPEASLAADFTATVTDRAEIKLAKKFSLEYVSGSAKKWTLSDPVNSPDNFNQVANLPDGITTGSGVNFGDPAINGIEGCWEYRGFITLWLRLKELSPPTGSVLIKKIVVDENNNPITGAGVLAGFEFKIQGLGINQTAITGENGEARFSNLPIGFYEVSETARDGYEIISELPALVNISAANLNWQLEIKNKKLTPAPILGSIKVVKILKNQLDNEIAKPNDLYKNWQIVISGANGFEKTVLTDNNGQVSFTNLALGAYEITQAAKDGWETKTSLPILVNLTSANPNMQTTIIDKEIPEPVITGSIKVVEKLLDGNGNEIAKPNNLYKNWQITIDGLSGEKTALTNESGEITFTNLTLGAYEINQAIKTGWISKTSLPVLVNLTNVNPNMQVSIVAQVEPQPILGSIKIVKTLFNEDGAEIAKPNDLYKDWQITIKGANGFTKTALTNNQGEVVFANLSLGSYEVNQTSKQGWILKTSLPALVNLTEANPNMQVRINDQKEKVLGSIEVTKILKDKNNVEIVKPNNLYKNWQITIKGANGFTKTTTTNEQGKVLFSGFNLGSYEVTQTSKDGWNTQTPLPILVNLTQANPNMKATITDKEIPAPILGSIKIVKTLFNEDGAEIAKPNDLYKDWQITIKGANGFTKTALTNNQGEVVFANLSLGSYEVNQTSKQGWILKTSLPALVNLTEANPNMQVRINDQKELILGSIKVNKILLDEDGSQINVPNSRLAGFEFRILGANRFSQTAITNESGQVIFSNLRMGDYEVYESDKEDYQINTPLPVLVSLSSGNRDRMVSITNKYAPLRGQIIIEKRLYDSDGQIIPTSDSRYRNWTIQVAGANGFNQNLVTDEGGIISIANLELGQYEINQISKDGWNTVSSLPALVNLTRANPIYRVIIEDQLIPDEPEPEIRGRIKVQLNLIDEKNRELGKPNAQYYNWQIALVGPNGLTQSLRTSNYGLVDFTDLPLGMYEVNQTTKSGWSNLTSLPILVDLTKENSGYLVNITNRKIAIPEPITGLVRIIKRLYDETGNLISAPNEELVGFSFQLNGPNGLVQTFTLGESGTIDTANLPLGEYTLQETSRDDYRLITEMPVEFRLTESIPGMQITTESQKIAPDKMPELNIKKYVSGDNGKTWYNYSEDGDILTVRPQSAIRLLYKIVVWNTGEGDAANVAVVDTIEGVSQYYDFIEEFTASVGTVSVMDNAIEGDGKIITYGATLNEDIAPGEFILNSSVIISGNPELNSSTRIRVIIPASEPEPILGSIRVSKILLDESGSEINRSDDLYRNWTIVLNGETGRKIDITDENGEALFSNLPMGDYEISQISKQDWTTKTSLPISVSLTEEAPDAELDIIDQKIAEEEPEPQPEPEIIIIKEIIEKIITIEKEVGGNMSFFIEKTARNLTAGNSDYGKLITAKSTDEIEYKIYFRNDNKATAFDAKLKDIIPIGANLISGTVQLYRDGNQIALGDIVDGWLAGLGDYKTGQEGYILFRVKLDVDLTDGLVLTNIAYISALDFVASTDSASVSIVSDGIPAPVEEDQEELPKAGANTLMASFTSLIVSILGYTFARARDEKKYLKQMALSYKVV